MKEKTLVYLERRQLRALRAEARRRGISLAELMRRVVDEHLERPRAEVPAVAADVYRRLVAIGSSELEDVAERHDAYLGAALRREHPG